uniref:Uncharacterized protein n=1 Tax=Pectinophora gossypiella TaxID=13191 RepID=A0A1E1WA33_PECGO
MADSDSSSSYSGTSEQSEEPESRPRVSERKRKRASKDAGSKRRKTEEGKAIERLTQQVSELQNFIYYSHMYQADNEVDPSVPVGQVSSKEKDNIFGLELVTNLKDPKVPGTSSEHLSLLQSLQHFQSTDWKNVRYYDTLKSYNSQPGFVELEVNDEIKSFDRPGSLNSAERFMAALTHGLIMQNEAMQQGFSQLLEWFSGTDLVDASSLLEKIQEIFSGNYQKISHDCLQMVCGRRADLIEQRRDLLLTNVKDKFQKTIINKIPPSHEHLFDKEAFTNSIKNSGGISKVFIAQKPNFTDKRILPGAQATQVPSSSGQQMTARSWAPSMNYRFAPHQGIIRQFFPAYTTNMSEQSFRPAFRPRWTGTQQAQPSQKQQGPRFSRTGQTSNLRPRFANNQRKF